MSSVEFTADGERLFVGGQDAGYVTGHERGAVDLSFSPDGRHLATAGADGTVRLFAMEIDELVRLARGRLTRSFTEAECQEFLHVEACPT